jgi:predicted metalloprotease with PDZ domain
MNANNKKQQKKQHTQQHTEKDEKGEKEKLKNELKSTKTDAKAEAFASPATARKPEMHKILNVTLVRNLNKGEHSFGFSLKGDTNDKSLEPHIDCVQPNSPAYRAGLQCYDKLIQVNGTNVANYPINKLIEKIEYETKLNPFKLNIVAFRRLNTIENSNETQSFSSSSSSISTNSKRTRCKYPKLLQNYSCLILMHFPF